MPSDPGDGLDDQLAELLASYDEALATGSGAGSVPDTVRITQPEAMARFEEDRLCLDLLERVWPRSPAAHPTPSGADFTLVTARPDVPVTIDRFEVRRALGAGGHGTVYLAYDPRLARDVALKVPRAEWLLRPDLRQRFVHEAHAAAALDHPNLIPVYEAGEAGGLCYIVSAYCHGPNLLTWARGQAQPVDPRTAAALVADLADGVQHAHDHGIVHRDIKPANILLMPGKGPAGLGFVPRLTDFGLARVAGVENDTRIGSVLGTPAYMAPEQADSLSAEVGPASDVYALGVVLYELLTGRTPFEGKTDLQTLRKVVTEEPRPPRRIRRDVPRDLETVCLKCLEKRPARRYSSAAELAADLRRFLAGEPVRARRLGAAARAGRWLRRRPMTAALAGVATLALVGLSAGSFWHFSKVRNLETVEKEREDRVRASERLILQNRYVDDLRHAGELWTKGRRTEMLALLRKYQPKAGAEDVRCFVWHYFWQIGTRQPPTLRHGRGDVYHASFSPDGLTLATAGQDRICRLWNVREQKEIGILEGHKDEVNWVAYSSDGKLLATASDDGTVRIWEAGTRRERIRFRDPKDKMVCAEFSADGKWLAAAGEAGILRVWRVGDGTTFHQHVPFSRTHKGRIESLAFSPDGKIVACVGLDGQVRLWDVEEKQERIYFTLGGRGRDRDYLLSVAFSPDGLTLAAGSKNGHIFLCDLKGKVIRALTTQGEIHSLAFSPDGHTLAASRDNLIGLWDVAAKKPETLLQGHTGRVWSLTFSRDGRRLASTSKRGEFKIWDPKLRQEYGYSPQVEIRRIIFSPEGARQAHWGGDFRVRVWDLATGTYTATFPLHSLHGIPRCLRFTPDGKSLAMLNWVDRKGLLLELHDLKDRSQPRAYRLTHDEPVAVGDLSPTGRKLAIARKSGSVMLWDVATDRPETEVARYGKTSRIDGLKFSPDDRWLAVLHRNCSTTDIWDLDNGRLQVSEPGDGRWIFGFEFLPDGKSYARNAGAAIEIRDTATGALRQTLRGHASDIANLAVCPDGKILATASERERLVKLWDLITGREVLALKGHGPQIVFSPDGKALTTFSPGWADTPERGGIYFWPPP
jgi:WD40 repeat protein